MKISIAWIFDHIDADWQKQDIEYLISQFNKTSAEIEISYKVDIDLSKFALASVLEKKNNSLKLLVPEWKTEIELPLRPENADEIFDLTNFENNNSAYMLYCDFNKNFDRARWAELKDFGLDKSGFVPSIDITKCGLIDWKNNFESKDIILEIDNKSITHRPDMWGHRGFAREIAAILDKPFLSSEKLLSKIPVIDFSKKSKKTKTNPIEIEIQDQIKIKRFAGIYLSDIKNKPVNIFVFSRFVKLGMRPINGFVDLTNYLMLDWSQPVHAYDAEKISGESIILRMANPVEKIELLDGNKLELNEQDIVIADKNKVLGLAGVMGGFDSAINKKTKKIFLESAIFDAGLIRKTSLRYRIRTESSIRFEKTLDQAQNVEGIKRFLFLAEKFGIDFSPAEQIISVGDEVEEKSLQIEHEFFEKKSGLSLSEYDIIIPLERLGFKVTKNLIEQKNSNKDRLISYQINIPTFRSSKDIEIPEDVLEEVIRFYGFDKIKLSLPALEKKPSDNSHIFRLRKIKNYFAFAAKMIEQQNYAFFDEQFLKSINLEDQVVAAEIINPVSENSFRVINSLIPGLFKNIQDNFVASDALRFFEFGRIWDTTKDGKIAEHKRISGIFFEKRQFINFYDCKSYVSEMFDLIGFDKNNLKWVKPVVNSEKNFFIWENESQTAQLFYEDKLIGRAGMVNKVFLNNLGCLPESDAFLFDLDADFLLYFKPILKRMKELPKYQETFFDLSFLVPLPITVKFVEEKLASIDKLITKVILIDFFEKEEWQDLRSLTFRVFLNHPEKTLQKEEIDLVWNKAIQVLSSFGAQLRS